MREVRLDALRVVQPTADAAAVGRADDQRRSPLSAGAVVHQRGFVDDLVERREDVVRELDLADGAHPAQRRANTHRDDAQLRQRRIDYAVRAVLLEQAERRAEDAAALAYVLAGNEYALVAGHFFVHGLPHAFDQRHFRHSLVRS